MRKTYEEAAVVVVLDAWLQQQLSRSISNVESMMRIALSGWTRRLWTFQEGSINKNDSIVFNDKIVDLDSHAENIKFCDHPSILPMTRYLLAVHEELRTLHLSESHDIRENLRRLIPCFRYIEGLAGAAMSRYVWLSYLALTPTAYGKPRNRTE